MAQYEVLLPKMGESVAEATIIKWEKHEGDTVAIDDILVEIATDKVDSEVPSPVAGRVIKQFFAENDIARVGDVIAIIETNEETRSDALEQSKNDVPKAEIIPVDIETTETVVQQKEQTIKDVKSFVAYDGGKFYSPLVKSMAQEEGITLQQLDTIVGTGADNRVTKHDVLDFIAHHKSAQSEIKTTIAQQSITAQAPESNTDEIVEMDRMRKIIAEHMVTSLHTAPHVTSFIEVDVTDVVQWRNKIKNSFEKREGIKITFTPIFVEAVAKALKNMPMVNVSVNGTQIIKKKNINIGMATALPTGNLIVPVIKNADQLSLLGLTKAVNDLASRARINKLQPDEVQGGTFTLTNLGAFGNIMGTPIINQPQVAILAVGVIQKKPAVLETQFGDVIAIRHKMYLSMSYDHRVVDGSLGGAFIKKVADYLEAWDVNRVV
ncbi:MAG: 2-oxo acid dehydrogenase subunit E2 [Sphingobacteriales bacterium]|nr:MAG: 2-oxo acid dehydrogenase subunit E2 [Sphingobacteriales bacterium]TAF83144.1 MAG: 2-oxo acid dehydrogenase subunit E2 [Sphingobacteriales bacterium]